MSLVATAGDFEFSEHFEGTSNSMVVYGNYAYYNTGADIHILDISNPEQIEEVKRFIHNDYRILDMAVQDHYLFMTSYDDGIKIYDLSDPLNPEYISNASKTHYPKAIIVSGNLMISITSSWPEIFDISDIYNPVYLSWIDYGSGSQRAYSLKNSVLYMSGWHGPGYDLYIVGFSLTDPSDPQLTVLLNLNASSTSIRADDMEVLGDYLCVAYNDTVKIFDISSPDTIAYLTRIVTDSPVYSMATHHNTLILGMENGKTALINLTDVFQPIELGVYQAPGEPEKIVAKDALMFLAMKTKGFQIIDISNPLDPDVKYENTKTEAFNIIHLADTIVYFSHLPSGLQAYNISNRLNPIPLGRIDSLGWLTSIKSVPGYLYCTQTNDSSLYVVDVTKPEHLMITDTLAETSWIGDYFIHEEILYIHTGDEQIKIYDLTIPDHPIKIDSFQVEGYILAGNDSLFILSIDEYHYSMNSYLLLYHFTGDSTSTLMYKLKLGLESTHRVHQLELNYPYIFVRVNTGVVIVKINPSLTLSICDQMLGYGFANHLCYDDQYIFLAGSKEGNNQIDIISWENPYQLSLHQTLSRYSHFVAVNDTLLYSSERYGGYSLFGYYPLTIPLEPIPPSIARLKVFPNPARNNVKFDISDFSKESKEVFTLQGYDLSGRKVMENEIRQGATQLEINTSHWIPGVYLFILFGKNGLVASCKVIVE